MHLAPRFACGAAALLLSCLLTAAASADDQVVIPGLQDPVQVVMDRDGVPHLQATNDLDLARAEGYVHARDRFFQMDVTRREISGDLAELLGPGEIGSDIQARTFGLRRAAERTLPEIPGPLADLLQAYADGVNAYLAANPLPPEYALLELTQARPWDVIDTLTLAKGLAANLSLDIDLGPTFQLQTFIEAGSANGFDGEALYFEDVQRSAPMDPASTVPDAGGDPTFVSAKSKREPVLLAGATAQARRAAEKLAQNPIFAAAMKRREFQIGSNEWGVSARHTATGRPIIANDPHLSLDIPATFYEWRLAVSDDPDLGPQNVSGVSFPGAPGVVLGQNEHVTWGATTNGLDVSDVFLDEFQLLTPDCFIATGSIACIKSEGVLHPVVLRLGVVYRFNQIGDDVDDNLEIANLSFEQSLIATVEFRSFGPIIDIAGVNPPDPGVGTALVLQYTGFHPTGELEAFFAWNRARNLDDFLEGLASFDVGAQNWAYADADGNLAFFSSAEAPLRKDLEAGPVDRKHSPAFIRDGSGDENWVADPAHSQGQAIPFAILPFEERPQLVNPPNGFFVNANNDPAGTTLDNDPLNQRRTSNPGATYYLSSGYASGLRAGRITRLVQQAIDSGSKISVADMQRFQGNTQQLDAELMTSFLLEAFENAQAAGAPTALAALAADPGVAEAVERLAEWDFSTPTGIPEGWDASDPPGRRRGNPPAAERRASVAATLYNLWRGKLIRQVIDARLASFGLGIGSGDALKGLFHLLSRDPYTGVGASGVDFIPEPASLAPEERRDLALLGALRTALDALASDEFAPAFGNSTDQDDYRWGKLHRIVFDHEFNPAFSIPPAAGFESVAPDLPGLARDGGYNVVNASGFSARADGLNSFRFGGGPVRRYVGVGGLRGLGGGEVRGFNVVPGGPSGDPASPLYATQLATWLTLDSHPVAMNSRIAGRNAVSRTILVPAP